MAKSKSYAWNVTLGISLGGGGGGGEKIDRIAKMGIANCASPRLQKKICIKAGKKICRGHPPRQIGFCWILRGGGSGGGGGLGGTPRTRAIARSLQMMARITVGVWGEGRPSVRSVGGMGRWN